MLAAAGFRLIGTESQIDHWFIPNDIMSPDEQSQWFDHEAGYALRIRQEITQQGSRDIITAKQLLIPGDHSSMTNHESTLTVAGARTVLGAIGGEFNSVIDTLRDRRNDEVLSFGEIKNLIEGVGRKEYITLDKERATFRNPSVDEITVDLDAIPALKETDLGYYAALEIEYTGDQALDEARRVVRSVSKSLGYGVKDILAKALPGQAIPYLAKF